MQRKLMPGLLLAYVVTVATTLVQAGGPACGNVSPRQRLLVVAPDRFHDPLAEYVAHKRLQLPTELLSLEKALRGMDGPDDPERLKRRLYEAWQSEKVSHVLLVGDADVLPVRYMVLDRKTPEAFDYAFYPSDLYYGDLARKDGTFDDWNAKKEGFHGEYFGEVRGEKNKDGPINFDAIDYLPEVAVGRWPVSSPKEVTIVLKKTMAYERDLRRGKKPNTRRAALVCVAGWVDCRRRMDRWALHFPQGWDVEKRYYQGTDLSPGAVPPTAEEITRILNDGLGVLLHAGHGHGDRWERSFALAHLSKVKNADRLGVVVSAACSTARFATLPPYESYVDVNGKAHEGTDHGEVFKEPPPAPASYQRGRFNPTGLGEQMVRRGPHGAVAYIGCNTGSQPCALTLLEGFVEGLRKEEMLLLGDCWNRAIAYYVEKERLMELVPTSSWYPPSIFFQGMKFMLFGDPTLPLPTPKD